MRRAPLAVAATLAVLAGGCGNNRQPPPDVHTPGPPLGSNQAEYPQAGLHFLAPAGWNTDAGQPPLVATIATGDASVAIFRYPRTEPLPKTRAQLDAALDSLVAAAKARDATFTELKRGRLRVDGKPAVQVRGTETIEGHPRTVRSTHVYAEGAEIVIDAFAPADVFKRVDAEVFRHVLRSMQISKPQGGP
jgi:hypothetical protein